MVAEQPDATLEQLRLQGGFKCSLKTLWYALDRLGLTRKQKSMHAHQRDRPDVRKKRRSFRRNVGRIEPKKLVFVDETGVATTMTPTYARASRGERAADVHLDDFASPSRARTASEVVSTLAWPTGRPWAS